MNDNISPVCILTIKFKKVEIKLFNLLWTDLKTDKGKIGFNLMQSTLQTFAMKCHKKCCF